MPVVRYRAKDLDRIVSPEFQHRFLQLFNQAVQAQVQSRLGADTQLQQALEALSFRLEGHGLTIEGDIPEQTVERLEAPIKEAVDSVMERLDEVIETAMYRTQGAEPTPLQHLG